MIPLIKTTPLLYVLLLAALLACKPSTAPMPPNPPGYKLEAAEKFTMPDNLLEISGIAFNKFDASRIYSIQDEEGRLFSQEWAVKKATSTRFGPRGDYEDLGIMDEQVFVLKSSGHIYGFKLDTNQEDVSEQTQLWNDLLPKGEYESLYADEKEQALYVLTKTAGKKNKKTLGFKLKYNKGSFKFDEVEKFELDVDAIRKFGFKLKSGLKVSALGRHPDTKEWYILSSADKLLVIANSDWTIKSVHDLDASVFSQPEGIAFDKDQNLYISNEGDELSNGNILKFKYNGGSK
jgi:hypothetical protein